MNISELKGEILSDLSAELNMSDDNFNETLLKSKIDNVTREVARLRRYPRTYTDEMKETDMESYYSVIRDVALYDYNMIGVEGQSSSSENGISRVFVKRESLLREVYPIARVL